MKVVWAKIKHLSSYREQVSSKSASAWSVQGPKQRENVPRHLFPQVSCHRNSPCFQGINPTQK